MKQKSRMSKQSLTNLQLVKKRHMSQPSLTNLQLGRERSRTPPAPAHVVVPTPVPTPTYYHRIPTPPIPSHHILSHRVPSHRIPSHPMSSHVICNMFRPVYRSWVCVGFLHVHQGEAHHLPSTCPVVTTSPAPPHLPVVLHVKHTPASNPTPTLALTRSPTNSCWNIVYAGPMGGMTGNKF